MRRVVWTDEAASDLDKIYDYVNAFNTPAARRLALRLMAAADSLETWAERGRLIGFGRRELLIVQPYLIRYKIDGDTVAILTVQHGARKPEEGEAT